ncbi:MAG: SRPBCC family protein [bacterium]|nr:SRPBCC family protein [bacterium]MYH72521.1 hypothetical protein [Acidimicrobiia bacterium]
MELSVSQRINVPIEEVFTYVADFNHMADWRKSCDSSQTIEGETGGGDAVYEQKVAMMGRPATNVVQITRFDQPTDIEFHIEGGPAIIDGCYRLSEEDSSTMLTLELDAELPKGLATVAEVMLKKQFAKDLEVLAATLEG